MEKNCEALIAFLPIKSSNLTEQTEGIETEHEGREVNPETFLHKEKQCTGRML